MTPFKDPLGNAIEAYYFGNEKAEIIVHSDFFEDDIIPAYYLFRNYNDFPELEKIAIKHCTGKTLDVGAGAGSHSLTLQSLKITPHAIDISEGAVKIMKERGILNPEKINFFDLKNVHYDTLLFLMNGIGIAGTLDGLNNLLQFSKSLLSSNGQIILDSTDISYMYKEDDGSMWIDLNAAYYGEVNYQMEYDSICGEKFNWLYIDYSTLCEYALANGFEPELLFEKDENFLARLTLKD